ncbi:hypothetical protein C427_4352 [Paraglaciecola psychrophila 170]|uniref:Uncharacterized protein n=1 Tax=Paraglaciecola psychrophila 170 TaxID=1129794 RepID=K6YZY2_9ALTE|nr:hypothetical protein C427_4352 [Paraglaciecola psychrophila 170]GAC38314.1 hypothetical protein GPSY_2702 [Paraglaciecola psychrophila 170]
MPIMPIGTDGFCDEFIITMYNPMNHNRRAVDFLTCVE